MNSPGHSSTRSRRVTPVLKARLLSRHHGPQGRGQQMKGTCFKGGLTDVRPAVGRSPGEVADQEAEQVQGGFLAEGSQRFCDRQKGTADWCFFFRKDLKGIDDIIIEPGHLPSRTAFSRFFPGVTRSPTFMVSARPSLPRTRTRAVPRACVGERRTDGEGGRPEEVEALPSLHQDRPVSQQLPERPQAFRRHQGPVHCGVRPRQPGPATAPDPVPAR